MPTNKHTFHEGAWAFCGRCGSRYNLNEMKWQRGKLLCKENCVDDKLIGQFDVAVAQATTTFIASPDLMPDPRLTFPTLEPDQSEIFI